MTDLKDIDRPLDHEKWFTRYGDALWILYNKNTDNYNMEFEDWVDQKYQEYQF